MTAGLCDIVLSASRWTILTSDDASLLKGEPVSSEEETESSRERFIPIVAQVDVGVVVWWDERRCIPLTGEPKFAQSKLAQSVLVSPVPVSRRLCLISCKLAGNSQSSRPAGELGSGGAAKPPPI